MKALALIPARGGSKGLKKKNIRPMDGKPLIQYTIDFARSNAAFFDEVCLSTDSEEIRGVGERLGLQTPFLRPSELATDTSGDLEVAAHALEWFERERGKKFDILFYLRPTTPLRNRQMLEQAQALLQSPGVECVRSVTPVNLKFHPYWSYRINGKKAVPFCEGIRIEDYLQRQKLPQTYHLNGVIDAIKVSSVGKSGLALFGSEFAPLVLPESFDIDIDTEADLARCEAQIRKNGRGMGLG